MKPNSKKSQKAKTKITNIQIINKSLSRSNKDSELSSSSLNPFRNMAYSSKKESFNSLRNVGGVKKSKKGIITNKNEKELKIIKTSIFNLDKKMIEIKDEQKKTTNAIIDLKKEQTKTTDAIKISTEAIDKLNTNQEKTNKILLQLLDVMKLKENPNKEDVNNQKNNNNLINQVNDRYALLYNNDIIESQDKSDILKDYFSDSDEKRNEKKNEKLEMQKKEEKNLFKNITKFKNKK